MLHKAPEMLAQNRYQRHETAVGLLDGCSGREMVRGTAVPDGRLCHDCGLTNTVAVAQPETHALPLSRMPDPLLGGSGPVMQSRKRRLQKWALAFYMMTTGIKGTFSMKIHRDLGIRQGTAWRIREGFNDGAGFPFPSPLEVNEACMGGLERNKHVRKQDMHRSRCCWQDGRHRREGALRRRSRPSYRGLPSRLREAWRNRLHGRQCRPYPSRLPA